jgi:hypothetical protein
MRREASRRSASTILLCTGALLVAHAFPARVAAQDIEAELRTLTQDNAELYIEPLTSGLAAALNSGFYHTAKVHDVLGFDFGIRVMGAFVPGDLDTFVPIPPESVEFQAVDYSNPYAPEAGQVLVSPTASGEGDGLRLVPAGAFLQALQTAGENPADYEIPLPQGFDLPIVPYGAIQGALGVPLGTEVVVRFIPSITPDEDVGSISMFGAGIKHSVDQWLPGSSPVNIALAFGFQHFQVGDYLDANSTQWSVIVSKDLSVLTLYAAGTIEDADLDVSYVFTDPVVAGTPLQGETIEFTQDTPNDATLALGATLDLGPVALNAGYTLGSFDVLTVSLLASIR